ncbi:MAG: hypothetical protein EPN97_12555 [Alphaproteobacteria bacterium]|nr:MAG: hypothetical protein EPN97_12555 [Alphaproteobacteria bacterium]
MASGFVKKGALVLAFAAATAGIVRYTSGPSSFMGGGEPQKQEQKQEQKIDKASLTPQQRTVYRLASEAALYQRQNADWKKALDDKKATKEEYEKGVQDGNEQIIQRRGQLTDPASVAFFDTVFRQKLKEMGVEAPAKMPEAHQTAAPATAPEVKQPEQPAQKKSPAPSRS